MTVFRGECQIKIDLESDKNLSKICLLHNLIVEYFYNTPQQEFSELTRLHLKKSFELNFSKLIFIGYFSEFNTC